MKKCTILLVVMALFVTVLPFSGVKAEESELAIGLEQLDEALKNESVTLVDLREDDAFIGYAVDGMERGGHLPGAIQFSYRWLSFLEENETDLVTLLEEKGFDKDKEYVLYSSNNEEALDLADQMKELGFKNISVFTELQAYAKDSKRELVKAENMAMTVSVEWLHELISGGKPEGYENDKYVILDCAWGEMNDKFKEGHIPGAYYFNTDLMEEDYYWNIRPIEELAESFRQFGIDKDTTVIVASNASSNVRIAFTLLYAGVEDVKVLNAKKSDWELAGYELSKEIIEPTLVDDFGITEIKHPEYSYPMPKDVLNAQEENEDYRLVAIRSWEEYTGEKSGYDYIDVAGEPKGSVWGHNAKDYYDVDGSFRNYDEILTMWAESDLSEDNLLSFYCGTGWRATVPFWISYTNGNSNVSIYDGGWHCWSMEEDLYIQVGDPASDDFEVLTVKEAREKQAK